MLLTITPQILQNPFEAIYESQLQQQRELQLQREQKARQIKQLLSPSIDQDEDQRYYYIILDKSNNEYYQFFNKLPNFKGYDIKIKDNVLLVKSKDDEFNKAFKFPKDANLSNGCSFKLFNGGRKLVLAVEKIRQQQPQVQQVQQQQKQLMLSPSDLSSFLSFGPSQKCLNNRNNNDSIIKRIFVDTDSNENERKHKLEVERSAKLAKVAERKAKIEQLRNEKLARLEAQRLEAQRQAIERQQAIERHQAIERQQAIEAQRKAKIAAEKDAKLNAEVEQQRRETQERLNNFMRQGFFVPFGGVDFVPSEFVQREQQQQQKASTEPIKSTPTPAPAPAPTQSENVVTPVAQKPTTPVSPVEVKSVPASRSTSGNDDRLKHQLDLDSAFEKFYKNSNSNYITTSRKSPFPPVDVYHEDDDEEEVTRMDTDLPNSNATTPMSSRSPSPARSVTSSVKRSRTPILEDVVDEEFL
ncbi:hypothetical protein B5S28_g2303 [[Candida] boidinii]|nr:hypothetical protein B5S28_g2303 [[Candida] boidinii]OWB62359.1 hypothetical protein B5S29_g3283 [[Candida] boidinii]